MYLIWTFCVPQWQRDTRFPWSGTRRDPINKTKKLPTMVVKLDLFKSYLIGSWMYLRLTYNNWVFLKFLHSTRGLGQGFLSSVILFLLTVEGVSKVIFEVKGDCYFDTLLVCRWCFVCPWRFPQGCHKVKRHFRNLRHTNKDGD